MHDDDDEDDDSAEAVTILQTPPPFNSAAGLARIETNNNEPARMRHIFVAIPDFDTIRIMQSISRRWHTLG